MLSPYALARPGGVQGQVIGLARSLRAGGHQVTVLAPGTETDQLPAGVGDHVLLGPATGLRSNGSVAPVALRPSAAVRAERAVRAGTFDVVHVHEPLAPVAAYGLVLRDPVPMVGTYHRSGVSRWVAPLRPLARLVGRRMQVRVAVSEAARETGSQAGGGAFEVLFNGIEMDRFESAPPRRDEEGRPVVVFVGRHEQRKGLGVLLDAFEQVERPAVLWVIGEGPATEMQRRRHPESDRLHWLGPCDDDEKAARLAGADVLCAPSLLGESFGMVLLEGMAARCTVLASDIDGYRLAAGGHAALVPAGDVAAWSQELGRALTDVGEGGGLASPAARASATAYARAWSMDTLAERYVAVYERAIESFAASH